MLYLLDSDHMSIIERAGADSVPLIERIKTISPDDYSTTIISYMEQTEGWLAELKRATNPAQEIRIFARLNENLRLYGQIAVWQYTAEAALRFEDLRRRKLRAGTQDLKIASIALVNGATLLTRNTRDFERIAELRIEDWTI